MPFGLLSLVADAVRPRSAAALRSWRGASRCCSRSPTWSPRCRARRSRRRRSRRLSLLLIAAGMLWLCLWRLRWRLLGLPAIGAGLAPHSGAHRSAGYPGRAGRQGGRGARCRRRRCASREPAPAPTSSSSSSTRSRAVAGGRRGAPRGRALRCVGLPARSASGGLTVVACPRPGGLRGGLRARRHRRDAADGARRIAAHRSSSTRRRLAAFGAHAVRDRPGWRQAAASTWSTERRPLSAALAGRQGSRQPSAVIELSTSAAAP